MQNDRIENIEAFLKENKMKAHEIKILSGDASSRQYYRIRTSDKSFCLSYDSGEYIQNRDFIKMSAFFCNALRTPKLIATSSDGQIVLQEDIGDISLSNVISLDVSTRKHFLALAIEDIGRYQKIKRSDFKSISENEFDRKKIEFEFDLAVKYFLHGHLKYNIDEKELKSTKEAFVAYFEANMSVVCHRDYHSRNLMIKDNELVHIDYQDARLGPITYDLVSLLEDCYFRYPEEEKEHYKKLFFEQQSLLTKEEFELHYNITVAQRLFKALGSFAFLKIEKNKNQYEKYIGHTFENLRNYLEKNKDLNRFREILCRGYYAN